LRAIFFSIQYNRDININYYNLNHKYKCMAVIGIKEQQANGNYILLITFKIGMW